MSGPQVPAEKLNFMKDKTKCSTRFKNKKKHSLYIVSEQASFCFVLWISARIQMWVCVGKDRGLGYTSHTGLYRCSKKKAVLCFKYLSLFRSFDRHSLFTLLCW